ncbi:MAG: TonB-dependent receptor [Cyclobacteriaceae bacterium]|jgi:TonB-dependent receptor
MHKLFISSVLVLFSTFIFAQKGTIRGTVIEEATGEPLFSVTVVIPGTITGSITDFDGIFSIQVEPGVYDIQVSFVSFRTITITGLEVKAGDVTVIDQIRLEEDVEELEAVVVTAQIMKSTEAALLTVKRKSPNMMDGISSASFRKIGDSNAASAVKRVTGVSIEGGKYVYVRGLGDRYTKTTLNSADIPGLDPDRNSLQIDIFPTTLLNNMIILKTASADQPADFTGGLINIETKDFPEKKILDVSLGLTYNPSMHFKSNALTYKGSSTDWLGFDSKLREIPSQVDNADLPDFSSDKTTIYNNSKLFSQQLASDQETNFMNYSLGLSFGDQRNLRNGNTLGYIFSGTYKRDNEFYQDVFYGEYQKRNESDAYELGTATTRTGAYTTESVLVGGLAGLAYKTRNAKYKLSLMHLQNGEKKTARIYAVSDPEEDDFNPRLISNYTANVDNLEYSQRRLTNVFLNGEHHFGDTKWKLEWKLSPSFSNLTDPDVRRAAFSTEAGSNRINPGAAGPPTRIWRFLNEANYVGKVDLLNNGSLFNREAKYHIGSSYVLRTRDYSIQAFDIVGVQQATNWADDASFNDILSEENLYGSASDASGNRMYYRRNGGVNPNSNAYESSNTNLAAYASAEISVTERLKTIVGVRMEMFEQKHTGMNQSASSALYFAADKEIVKQQIKAGEISGAYLLDDDVVLNDTDFFPSLNAIYSLTESQNLRFSASKTIARPSFKELSYAQILDPVSNRTFNGSLFEYKDDQGNVIWDGNLTETRIDNFDLRWELFLNRDQLFSVSTFYKSFNAPIEMVRITSSQTGNEFQARNVGNGQILGAELEFRKALDFLGSKISNFSVYGNVTLVESSIDMTSIEYNSRLVYKKDGEKIKETRAMAGQAPYVINFGLQYNDAAGSLDAGLFYNVKGKTLTIVGEGFFPDIYSQPFNSLNFNLNKTLGANQQTSINLSVNNILDDKREEFYVGYKAKDQIFNQLSPGREIGVGFKYSF